VITVAVRWYLRYGPSYRDVRAQRPETREGGKGIRNPVDRGSRPRSDQVLDPDRKEVGDDDPVRTTSRRTP